MSTGFPSVYKRPKDDAYRQATIMSPVVLAVSS